MEKTLLKEKRGLMICFALSIICIGLFILFIPHQEKTLYTSNEIIKEKVIIQPLNKEELLVSIIQIFLLINIPSFIILIRKLIRFIQNRTETE